MKASERLCAILLLLSAVALIALAAAQNAVRASSRAADQADKAIMPTGKPLQIKAPLGLPPVPIPADNPPTAETVAFGRRLYYDPVLSADTRFPALPAMGRRWVSPIPTPCPLAWEGKRAAAIPPVINLGYNTLQFWDGRAPSLEEQAKGPIANPVEMVQPDFSCGSRHQ